jgi:hypothetical protein
MRTRRASLHNDALRIISTGVPHVSLLRHGAKQMRAAPENRIYRKASIGSPEAARTAGSAEATSAITIIVTTATM